MHCVVNADGSITHFLHDHHRELYASLANWYVVCLVQGTKPARRVTGAFIVKSSYAHGDAEFDAVVAEIVDSTPELRAVSSGSVSVLKSRLGVPGEEPLSEREMLSVIQRQVLQHSSTGQA
jgi:hypothetical protein